MTCDVLADANDFASYWNIEIDAEAEPDINRRLEMAASNVHMAMLTMDMCDCALSATAEEWIKQLTLIFQAVLFPVFCGPEFTDAENDRLLRWANDQLDQIKSGKIELCDGETGSSFPVIGWAQKASTEFAAAEIIVKDIMRNRG